MSVELKPRTKVLKNLFHDIALKNLYVTLNYLHILALVIRCKENVVVFFQFDYAEFSGYVLFFRF